MKKAFLAAVAVTMSCAIAEASIGVSSPGNGATIGSPVHFVASASSSNPITGMTVYADNNVAYTTTSNKIDAYVNMAAGSHYVVVQAWDSTGAVQKAPAMTINVSGSSSGGPPPSAAVYSNVDQMTGWQSCDTCAGPGGNGPQAAHSLAQFISNPSLDGKSAQFNLGGSAPYSSALWWRQLGANASASNFVYDLYFYLKNPAASQALEFDINQSVNGQKFIFGTQCDIRDHRDWDVWDTANSRWVQTGIACAVPAAYSWNHLTLEFQRTGGQAKFIAVTLNGKKSYINKAFWPIRVNAAELNVAFQMDGNSSNANYSAWLDGIKLSAW